MATRYTEEEIRILKEYYPHHNTAEVAKMLNRNVNTVGTMARYYGLRKSGIGRELANKAKGKLGVPKTWIPEQTEYLKTWYPHIATRDLVIVLGRKESAINREAGRLQICKTEDRIIQAKRERAINLIPFHFVRKYSVNEHFFCDIDTEEKAYFLGLMWADGNVTRDGWAIQITLQKRDEHILDKFVSALESDYPLHDRVVKDNHYTLLYMTSKTMVSDLISQGVIPAKTFGKEIPNISPHLVHHFVRGLFDGDGSIVVNPDSYTYTASICNTQATVNWLYYHVADVVSVGGSLQMNHRIEPGTGINIHGHSWDYRCGGRLQASRWGQWMYKDASFYLQRKYDKFASFVDLKGET